mmetsp:Transcript_107008/g.320046  ORF Transcript_107008/g.320046 Transcript_107008/m.320046 type:complete len:210 (-) Transcript_107008:226-855(-)
MCSMHLLGQAFRLQPSLSARQSACSRPCAHTAQACRFWKTVPGFRTRLPLRSSQSGGLPAQARGRSQRSLTAASTIFRTASASMLLPRRSTSSRKRAWLPMPTCLTSRTTSVMHLSPPSGLSSQPTRRMAETLLLDRARCTASSSARTVGSGLPGGVPAARVGDVKASSGCPLSSMSVMGIIWSCGLRPGSRELKPFSRRSTVTAFRKR